MSSSVCLFVCLCVCVYVCMYVCVYVSVHYIHLTLLFILFLLQDHHHSFLCCRFLLPPPLPFRSYSFSFSSYSKRMWRFKPVTRPWSLHLYFHLELGFSVFLLYDVHAVWWYWSLCPLSSLVIISRLLNGAFYFVACYVIPHFVVVQEEEEAGEEE